MYGNSVKEDLRVIKTKRALVIAFGELMREKPLEKLTVNDLCDRAGVRRATFYKHFKDKNDFMVYLIKVDRQTFLEKKWQGNSGFDKNYFIAYVSNLIENLAGNSLFVENIIASTAKHILIESIISQNYETTLEIFKRAEKSGVVLAASCENLTAMLIGGVAVVIYNWCHAGMVQPKDELIAEISAIIDRILC